MPKRIQRPWRWPDRPTGVVDVSRASTRYGNPFRDGDRDSQVSRYRAWVLDPNGQPITYTTAKGHPRTIRHPDAADIAAISGYDLACFCRLDEACHADVLLELANHGAGVCEDHGEDGE